MAKRNKGKIEALSRPTTNSPSRRPLILIGLVALAALVAFPTYHYLAGKTHELSELVRPGEAAGYNLLLVTLDTVRSDRLGCYGYAPARTPAIDSLAAAGVLFEQAVTSMPLTLPSHTTMLTGLHPPRHGVRGNGNFRLDSEFTTLTESLKERGYDTAAFLGCFVLDARFGLDQGFDVYDFESTPEGFDPSNLEMTQRPANAVSDAAIGWLQTRESTHSNNPFFLWVHYFDAHRPYQSPYVKLPQFAGRPYDAEIAYVDVHFKRLLDELDRRALRDKTLIAVVSDHGEGLDEHGESTHGMQIYDSTLRVAFILSNPNLFDGPIRVADRLVSLADLRPTLAGLLGLPLPAEADGESLLRLKADPERAVYLETQVPFHAARCSPLYGLRRLADKYIRAPEPEYYALGTDPRELSNLHDQRAETAAALDARLSKMMEGWAAAGVPDGRRSVSSEEQGRLSALGYVEMDDTEIPTGLPDPKSMLRANRQISMATQMLKSNRLEEALRYSRAAVDECPAFPDTSEMFAAVCEKMNRHEDAIEPLRRCLQMNPKCRSAIQLARMYMGLKRLDEMNDALDVAERLDPGDGMVYILRGDLELLRGRIEEALSKYEQAVRIDEQRVGPLARPQIEKLRAALRKSP